MEKDLSLFKYAKNFFAGTALSRMSGLFRDIAMAISFGGSVEIASFFVAFRFANLFRRILGEGNLQSGFTPQYLSLKEDGPKFYRDTTFSMAVILFLTIACLEALFAVLLLFADSEWQEILQLTMWMVPGLFFICLYSLNSSFLQCRNRYFLPAAAPILFNFAWVFAALYSPSVSVLAIAVTVAFAGQWFVTIFEGFKALPLREWIKPKLFSEEFKALLKPLSLGFIGIGAVQLNSALDPIFARVIDPRGPAFLWYAIRIEQLPFALFGIALSNALLPALSRVEDRTLRDGLLNDTLKKASAIMLFCTFGIFALGDFGINFLYGHGDFSALDVQNTFHCLWGYGLGLTPSVFVLLLSARYYAEKDYKTPAMAALLSVGVNIGLNVIFVFGFSWSAFAVAIATSIAAFCNVAYLSRGFLSKELWLFVFKMGLACIFPTTIVFAVQRIWMELYPRDIFAQIFQLIIATTLYCVWVFIGCKVLKIDFRSERAPLKEL
jgi:putative peptidoglycan lipid II flippase